MFICSGPSCVQKCPYAKFDRFYQISILDQIYRTSVSASHRMNDIILDAGLLAYDKTSGVGGSPISTIATFNGPKPLVSMYTSPQTSLMIFQMKTQQDKP